MQSESGAASAAWHYFIESGLPRQGKSQVVDSEGVKNHIREKRAGFGRILDRFWEPQRREDAESGRKEVSQKFSWSLRLSTLTPATVEKIQSFDPINRKTVEQTSKPPKE